jgi:serine/threonine protein phosphatase PrpC
MKFSFSFHSDIGKRRNSNQDFILEKTTENGHVFIVCDGMGGHAGGEVAARIAAETILHYFEENVVDDLNTHINKALQKAHKTIISESNKNHELKGMGTAACILIVKDENCYMGHIGDSRIYFINKSNLIFVTKDHSLIQLLIDKNEIEATNAKKSPYRNVITRALGVDFRENENYFDGSIKPDTNSYFLICTDGLNAMINDRTIVETILNNNIDNSPKKMIDLALNAGGHDNVSVIVIKITSSQTTQVIISLNTEKEVIQHGRFKRITNFLNAKK